ncbi:MAG TPA: MAPEG family protein [Allosphingosinicella sp.]|nr:MAPEG family protein [Allosphingosinicella sp.]
MTTELEILAWGCILALVHIFAAVRFKTRQYGTKWNIGARDEELAPPEPIVGRLARAQANFFETFPIFIAAVLIVSVAGLEDRWTALGAWLWLGARIVYLPLYAFGVPVVRTLAFLVSVAGIALVLRPALAASLG